MWCGPFCLLLLMPAGFRLLGLLLIVALAVANASFIGAVVEFSPSFPDFGKAYSREEAVLTMMQNVHRLDAFAAQARSLGAQIIVFPEYGIQADEPFSNWTRAPGPGSIVPFTEPIPHLHANPCVAPQRFPGANISVALSCMAVRHNMTIVAAYGDLVTCAPAGPPCRADGMAMYNTAVAFGEDGTVIGRYHKHHLFEEPYYDVDATQNRTTFVTSFGVEFGVFICFDIIFEVLPWPKSVTHFVFPTEWSNTFFPGLTAHREQQLWTALHGAVLLAANQGQNANISGSGIWQHGTELAAFFNPTMAPQDKLLVATVTA